MVIQNNIMALNANRNTQLNTLMLKTSLQKLSSGYRINSAADDAAGLAISELLRAQTTGTSRAMANSQDGVSLVQTAEGALGEMHSMLNRLTDLSVQASNGILSDEQRASIQNEAGSILEEIDRIAASTNFNGTKMLNGSLSGSSADNGSAAASSAIQGVAVTNDANGQPVLAQSDLTVFDNSGGSAADIAANVAAATFEVDGHKFALVDETDTTAAAAFGADVTVVGVEGTTGSLLGADLQKVSAAINGETGFAFEAGGGNIAVRSQNSGPLQLQIGDSADEKISVRVDNMSSSSLGLSGIDLTTVSGASQALASVRSAINTVSSTRGDLGATQNRLEHTYNNLGVKSENIQAAESRIRDADMARMMMDFVKSGVLQQSGNAMQTHAMMQSQQVLQMLN